MRRPFLAVLAAVLLSACQAAEPAAPAASPVMVSAVGCPPLTPAMITRALAESKAPAPDLTERGIEFTQIEELCRTRPKAVICVGGAGRQLTLSEVVTVDQTFRPTFQYLSDYIQFGVDDHWVNLGTCGDCEDYALTLSERLHRAGASGASMRLLLWSPEPGYAHATLLVATADAGLIEVGVGEGETPHPMDWSVGERLMALPMDGSHARQVAAGFSVWRYPNGALAVEPNTR